MKRFPVVGVLLLVPALGLVLMIGCSSAPKDGKSSDNKGKAGDSASTDSAKPKGETKTIAPGNAVVKGVVSYDGTPPEKKPLPALLAHKDKDQCLEGGGTNVIDQTWIVSEKGGVANAVVWLEPKSGSKFEVSDKAKEDHKNPAVVDQPYCAYVPHVVAVLADVQPVIFKNSAKFSHNTKYDGGVKNGTFDKALSPKAEEKVGPFKKVNDPINVQCSMHGFMSMKILTFDHPYYAVTKEDGSYEIPNVPTGEEFTVMVWHEGTGKKDEGKVTLKSGETKDLNYKVK